MNISRITLPELNQALAATNAAHGYKLIWNRKPDALNAKGTRFACTIRSEVSGIRGARTSASGRNLPAASWHAHGHLYEAILTIAPQAVISAQGRKITAQGGNWVDWNAGSPIYPAPMSSLSIL